LRLYDEIISNGKLNTKYDILAQLDTRAPSQLKGERKWIVDERSNNNNNNNNSHLREAIVDDEKIIGSHLTLFDINSNRQVRGIYKTTNKKTNKLKFYCKYSSL
jgi:hypothetical protein